MLYGQEVHSVYRFSVEGITEPVLAKEVQWVLSQEAYHLGSSFVDEADVFKLETATPLEYDVLAHTLAEHGFFLVGPIAASDGTILSPPAPQSTSP